MFDRKKYLYVMVVCYLVTWLWYAPLWAKDSATSPVSGRPDDKAKKAQAPQENPQISFDAVTYDAGEVGEGDTISHDFIVRNRGTAELTISSVQAG